MVGYMLAGADNTASGGRGESSGSVGVGVIAVMEGGSVHTGGHANVDRRLSFSKPATQFIASLSKP